VGGTWSTTAITWSVLGLRRNIVPGTSATRMPTIRNANGTRATTIDRGRYFNYGSVNRGYYPVLRLRRLIVGGNVLYDRSTASVLIEREATMVVLMRTMVYGPSKLCGTKSMVWAVDGTSAIWIRPIRIVATEGGGCKKHTIGSYVA